jgi:3-oxoacyl-[acyl-carrier protein] reductase
MRASDPGRPVALVTGVSRLRGIGSSIAYRLARDGWNVALTYWRPYDARMPWGSDADDLSTIQARLRSAGAATVSIEANLADAASAADVFAAAEAELGAVSALVLAHCESVASGIMDTSLESFDQHFAVNVRASWLLTREFAARFDAEHHQGRGRILALTSDHVVGNLPYGSSKGALDRIVLPLPRSRATSASRATSSIQVQPTPGG